ncbi:hypothetical protein D9757_001476 [Collybiopsis confluens]|uniref:ATP-dependent RNA helicase n=1 Tax=Collybiopsis confluens TaxID=2823264 RepID=A0A8H5MFM6_9AGAR|nr:hypothetical protein D9757_001476 [Collybiopsis confluens]
MRELGNVDIEDQKESAYIFRLGAFVAVRDISQQTSPPTIRGAYSLMEGTAKDKTKAKQRYLKRKKERRKHSTKKTEPGRQEEDEDEEEDEPPAKRQRLSEEPTPAALPTFPCQLFRIHLQNPRSLFKRLIDLGVAQLFAVQTSLLPFLLPHNPLHRALYQPYHPPQDVCVSAPTGSGKTLAYVVPIVEILSSRIVTRLRALIVLPTRDLVLQVRETFEAIGKGRGLKIGTATGQHSFSHEQAQLVGDRSSSLLGGSSKIDILICTPGRLIDHLKETPNFSLQHLRFLVVDEADRLLAQTFQDWLSQVLAATRPPKQLPNHTLKDLLSSLSLSSTDNPPQNISLSTSPDTLSPSFLHLLPYPSIPSFITEHKQSSCQKLLFSATLTSDPGKIAALELRNPKYFIVQGGSSADTEGGEAKEKEKEKEHTFWMS